VSGVTNELEKRIVRIEAVLIQIRMDLEMIKAQSAIKGRDNANKKQYSL
jgi:hypothetical protein